MLSHECPGEAEWRVTEITFSFLSPGGAQLGRGSVWGQWMKGGGGGSEELNKAARGTSMGGSSFLHPALVSASQVSDLL